MSNTTTGGGICWRAGPARELAWSALGDAYVVYHRPSGRTHFLNAATADLLEHVLAEPRTAEDAAEALATREGAPGSSEFFAAVAQSLALLEHLGLVERCEP